MSEYNNTFERLNSQIQEQSSFLPVFDKKNFEYSQEKLEKKEKCLDLMNQRLGIQKRLNKLFLYTVEKNKKKIEENFKFSNEETEKSKKFYENIQKIIKNEYLASIENTENMIKSIKSSQNLIIGKFNCIKIEKMKKMTELEEIKENLLEKNKKVEDLLQPRITEIQKLREKLEKLNEETLDQRTKHENFAEIVKNNEKTIENQEKDLETLKNSVKLVENDVKSYKTLKSSYESQLLLKFKEIQISKQFLMRELNNLKIKEAETLNLCEKAKIEFASLDFEIKEKQALLTGLDYIRTSITHNIINGLY